MATNDTVESKQRIFLSCVSREFRSYRLKLANQLGALSGEPYLVNVQEDFQQGGFTLLEALADYVRDCDLVIHITGDLAGASPEPEHERTLPRHLGEPDSTNCPGWSYTEWEYWLARRFNKRIFVYRATDAAPRDCGLQLAQESEDSARQQRYIAAMDQSGEHWKPIDGAHTLVREVFHDLGLELSHKINNLPFKSLGSLFKGREVFLQQIHDALGRVEHRGHQRFAAITANATVATVYGLGGIGKTRAAIEYAHRHAADFTALLFVSADSPSNLHTNLAALCGAAVLNLTEQTARETEVQLAAVLRWLQQHPGWFLILDNVDTEEAATAVEQLLGQLQSAGQVLVTSRLSRWSGAVEALALDLLDETAAAEFLLARTDQRRAQAPDDEAQARALAIELGQLALALEQAGAYIVRHRRSFADYLREWQERHDHVLAWFDERLMQYPRSVAITWQTSFDQLSAPARRLLYRLAWLAPDPIPESLLDVAVPAATDNPATVRDSLVELDDYSLATRSPADASFTIHRLVQDVTRRSLRDEVGHTHLTEALGWINAAFVGDPQDVRSWSTLDPLASHVAAVVGFADQAAISNPTSRLMNDLGLLLYAKAHHAQAEPLMRRALAIDEQSYGAEHSLIALRLHNIASLLQATNRLAEAESLMRQALAIEEQSDGIEHPNVAICLNSLSSLLQATNRLTEAEQLIRRALAIDEQSYDAEHPNVGLDLSNLAEMVKATNRLAEAAPLMRRALAIHELAYGTEPPKVATCLNNLALLLRAANRLDEAERLMRRALAIDEQSQGTDHPAVARDLNNLAGLFEATNRLAEAERLYRRALAIDQQSYGADHPDVAIRLNNLSRLLQATNRLAEAEPLMRRHLEIFLKFTQATGHAHPHLRAAIRNYAGLMMKMGLQEREVDQRLNDLRAEYGLPPE